ncbi:DNA repair protein XRCC2 [Erpetoichthys calabaricus]|uniref:X-ray repair cross complementing 2 n=1 Tax=Erpetoichthys calabaricus TaxID=27687 RepID=A0A8C4T4J6_ERPCA|nr:DNA repair protein XRCC2 [Erpetoichthys calabaricus]
MSREARLTESGTELLARLGERPSLKSLELPIFSEVGFPGPGDVVELHGAEGTGKTELLYHVLVHCILPTAQGGLEVEVLFVDTDFHFDMLRLVALLEQRLPGSPEALVRRSLRRLTLVQCSSSVQLLLTLRHLESLLCGRTALGVLMLDSLSAFYWTDRSAGREDTLRRCSEFLQKLVKDYHLLVFAATQALMRAKSGEGKALAEAAVSVDSYRPYLCRAWQRMVTHRAVVGRAETGRDGGPLFSLASCSLKSRRTWQCHFGIGEGGVHFV